MSNCHNLFQQFNDEISIPGAKRARMTKSKTGLRDAIRAHFKEHHSGYTPLFFIQGSDKMKTGIRTKDDICDLDDGVYFMREPDVSAATLQGWVRDAVAGYTNTPPQHKEMCVRSIFAGDYEVDHPVYYKVDGKPYQIATKTNGWRSDDPKEMVDWFVSKKDQEGHLIFIVKCLKAWGDYKRNQMPPGLAMTILAAWAKEKFFYNDRDDINLTDTLREIKKALQMNFSCVVPAIPNDDLFADYDPIRQKNFMTALDDFLEDAELALKEKNQLKASQLWRKHLGDRFPEGEDKDENENAFDTIITGAKTANPYAYKG